MNPSQPSNRLFEPDVELFAYLAVGLIEAQQQTGHFLLKSLDLLLPKVLTAVTFNCGRAHNRVLRRSSRSRILLLLTFATADIVTIQLS